MAQQAKCLTKKNITLRKRATGRSSSYEKIRRNIKTKMCAEKMQKKKLLRNKSSCLEVFWKKGVIWNFAEFTWKHLCQSLVLINILTVYYFCRSFIKNFWQGPEYATGISQYLVPLCLCIKNWIISLPTSAS